MRKLLTALGCLFSGCRESTSSSQSSGQPQDDWESKIVWIEAGTPGNPFPHRVLDCRAVALGFTATTSDPAIATRFVESRTDDGRFHIGTMPTDPFRVDCDLRFPYNGQRDEGVIYSAREMEDKWDFFVYDFRLYICRSWSGVLAHVAELRYTDTDVVITAVHSNRDLMHNDAAYTKAHIRFLVMTHLGRQKLAFPIPPGTDPSDTRAIALAGFSSYGRRAEFASIYAHE